MSSEKPPSPVEIALVGRERDAARIEDLVCSIERGPAFVVIRGEAGIGKTSLWRWALARSRQAQHLVLATRASEEDVHGPMVGLIDLFERAAVDDDLLIRDLDRYERGHRVQAALSTLATTSPLVVAIDDVQWLDPVSAGALRYAFRRLEDEPILVLATERSEPARPPDDRTIPLERSEEIALGPLPIELTRDVVSSAVAPPSRPVLERIHALSGGNPMYAIELARAVELFDDPLVASVPPTLREVLARRIGTVADELVGVLQVAAALGPADVDTLARASGSSEISLLLDDAVEQQLLVADADGVVRFDHPLVAAAVLSAMNPLERQALHERLAAIAEDPDARARHLVRSCAEPDAAIATELEAAARRAGQRGASALAAELAAHCVRITPADDASLRTRRQFLAIHYRAAAGETTRAVAETDALIAALPAGSERAEAISLRVGIDFAGGDRYLEQALREVGDDEFLRGRILEMRAWMATTHRSEPAEGLALGEQALAIAERLSAPTLEMLAASTVALAALMLGEPRPDLLDRAQRLATAQTETRLGHTPQIVEGRIRLWCGQLARARSIFEALHATNLRAGLEFQRPYRLLDLALVELASGNLTTAAELAEDGIEAARDARNEQGAAWLAYPAGHAAAHLGRTDRARWAAGIVRSLGADSAGYTRLVMADHVMGVVALAAGEPAQAVAALWPGVARLRSAGVLLPSVVSILPDALEALALSGDAATCTELITELDRRAGIVEQPWITATVLRGRGLAAYAAGAADAAPMLAEAAAMFDELGYRVDAARSLLVQGRALRRAGQRNASAATLTEAQARFATMGAAPWVAQTTDELARVAPTREGGELTPTESRVGALVVAGRRNREIAAELNISVATVEAHLTRMYRKMHVRSRTELTRVLR